MELFAGADAYCFGRQARGHGLGQIRDSYRGDFGHEYFAAVHTLKRFQDQVDALLQDFPINHMHTEADQNYTVVAKYETDESYGFAFAKDKNPALLAAVDAELQAMREDGTYQTIYDKYFA